MKKRPILGKVGSICVMLLLTHSIWAQVNIKIGYNTGFVDLSNNDQLLESYQPSSGEIVEEFGDLNFMHGIQLGLRYSFSSSAFVFGWENMSRERTALSFNEANETFIDRTYGYTLNTWSLGFENYFGSYGIGSSIQNTTLKVDRQIDDNDLGLVKDDAFNLRLEVIWIIQKSDWVSLVLKPYYQFPLGKYDLSPLAQDLGAIQQETEESLGLFGLSFVFYNGKQ